MTEAKNDQTLHVEDQMSSSNDASPDKHDEHIVATNVANKRLMRKVDFRLIPMLIPIYALSLIDRTNLGGARISGIDEDIGLNLGNRYSVAILVFYIGYIFFELPSNIALKKVGAPRWLGILAVTFGICTLGMGLAKNYATVVALRVLLGCLEAGLFPGCIYLISSWYPRYSVQKRQAPPNPSEKREHVIITMDRIAVFYSSASFLSSFANILAYGLTQIADQPERYGWRWIFIVQGAITVGIGIMGWLVLPDFPESSLNKFLSSEERHTVNSLLITERGDAEAGKVTWKVVKSACTDWYTWTTALVYMGGSCGAYSFLFFLPLILRNSFNFSQSLSFYLCTPPAAFAIICALAVSWISDRTQMRGVYVIIECLVGVAGLAMTGFASSPTPRYIGTFLGMAGTTTLITTSLAWGQNNVRSDAKRSVATVIQVVCAAIGGIYSSLVFRNQDAPAYLPGIIAVGALLLFDAVLAAGTIFFLWKANKKVDRGEMVIEGAPEFRFTL